MNVVTANSQTLEIYVIPLKTELLRKESKAGIVSYLKVSTSELKYVKSTSSKSSSSSSLHLCIQYQEHLYSKSRQSSEFDNSLSFYSLVCIKAENLTRFSSDIMVSEKSDFIQMHVQVFIIA